MTDILPRQDAHANAATFKIEYPDGTAFAEDLELDPMVARIPVDRYTSTETLAREIDGVWKHVWQMVCREDEIAEPGSFVTYRIADQEFLVVRQADGGVKAFPNACLHRGNLLRTGSGKARDLRCRFHHWCWEIDGSLKEIPDRHLFVCLEEQDLSLSALPCETWSGFVFVNPDRGCTTTLLEFLGPIVEQLAPYRFDQMVTTTNVTQPVSCNWKTAIEAFLESYHTMGIHPQLLRSMDDVNTTYELLGDHSRMIVPLGTPSMRLDEVAGETVLRTYTDTGGALIGLELDPGDVPLRSGLPPVDGDLTSRAPAEGLTVREWLIDYVGQRAAARARPLHDMTRSQYVDDWHYFIYPGLVFNTNPMSSFVLRVRPHESNPDTCWIDVLTYAWPDAEHPSRSRRNVEVEEGAVSYGEVLNQDLNNLPLVQRGMHNDAITHLIMSKQELRIVAFHETLQRYLKDQL